MADVDLNLLGPVRLMVAGRHLALSRRQPLVLLAYLAVADGPIARDSLAFLFWADTPQEIARQRLRRILGQLRKMLQAAERPDLVRIQGEWLSLDHERCQVDVREFQRLAPDDGIPDRASIARGEAAIARYGGAFLAGMDLADSPELDHWLAHTRERLEQRYFQCLSAVVDGYVTLGDTRQAIPVAERLLVLDPLREEAHRSLMRLYAASGQRALALRQYARCSAALATELGVEPLAETSALHEALLRDEFPTAMAVGSAKPAWPIRTSLAVPCFGRDREVAQLAALLEQGLRGQPTIACISGPAGIGKTRLIQEAVRRSALPVWLSIGQPAESGVPYGAVLPALRAALTDAPLPALPDLWLAEVSRVLPEVRAARPDLHLPPSLPPEQAQTRLFEGLSRLMAALTRRDGGTILVLDNLEAADAISLGWLANLLRHADNIPLGLVVAFRPPTEQSPLHHWLDHLSRSGGGGREIVLTPLSLDTTTAIIRHLELPATALSGRLWSETGGNPFFLLETLRLITEQPDITIEPGVPLPLPATVQGVIGARLRAVDQISRQVIDAAAILAPSFDAEVVRVVGGRDELETAFALDALVAAQLLAEEGTSYRFAHAQIADVVYSGVGGARRRLLHRRAADALQHQSATRAAVLAHHLECAGQPTAAAEAWLAAAGQAAGVFAAEEALACLARGLALVGDPGQRCTILALREDLFDHLGRRPEQAADLDELADLAAHLGSSQCALALYRRGRYLIALGRWGEAERALREALALGSEVKTETRMLLARTLSEQQRWEEADAIGVLALQEADRAQLKSRALHTLAQLARTREDRATHESYLRQALAITPETDPLRARLLLDLGDVLFRQGQHDPALAIANEALHLAETQASRATEALAHNQVGNCLTRLNRNVEALEAFRRAGEAHRAIENRAGQAAAVGNVGVLAMRMGLLEESLVSLTEAHDLFAALGNVPGRCLSANNLGTALIWLDRSAEAIPHLQQALSLAITAKLPIREAATCCNLGAALLDIGRLDDGLALMQRGVELRRDLKYGDLCIDYACLAIAYLRVGQLAEADRLSQQALKELPDDGGGVGHPHRVAFGRAQVLHALGHAAEAEGALAQAWEQCERYTAHLTTTDERARYRTAFVFNRDLQATRLGHWPNPPRLV